MVITITLMQVGLYTCFTYFTVLLSMCLKNCDVFTVPVAKRFD